MSGSILSCPGQSGPPWATCSVSFISQAALLPLCPPSPSGHHPVVLPVSRDEAPPGWDHPLLLHLPWALVTGWSTGSLTFTIWPFHPVQGVVSSPAGHGPCCAEPPLGDPEGPSKETQAVCSSFHSGTIHISPPGPRFSLPRSPPEQEVKALKPEPPHVFAQRRWREGPARAPKEPRGSRGDQRTGRWEQPGAVGIYR